MNKSIIALLLLVPAPSLGLLAGLLWLPNTFIGTALFSTCKIWLLLLPLFWHKLVDHEPYSLSPSRKGGFPWAILSGIIISAIIFAAYYFVGPVLIDFENMKVMIEKAGLGNATYYFIGSAYWILINSVLEEYVWRWFVVKKCLCIFSKYPAVIASALFFTIHHFIALYIYMGFAGAVFCSAGIFIGALVWSHMYLKYESIWPGYVSHAIVDLTVFLIGARIVFG